MKILLVSDEESKSLWDYYKPGMLSDIDLILSAGDLQAEYLSFLVTMSNKPLLYVCGNHDWPYLRKPPEGCDCIEDKVVTVKGLRILGLGGTKLYGSFNSNTEKEMEKRIRKLRRKIKKAGGVDIVLTHAPIRGMGDSEDIAHRGYEVFLDLIREYNPAYFIHGHVHKSYTGAGFTRVRTFGETQVINANEKYILEIEEK